MPSSIPPTAIPAVLPKPHFAPSSVTQKSMAPFPTKKTNFPPFPGIWKSFEPRFKARFQNMSTVGTGKSNPPPAIVPEKMSKLFRNTASPPAISDRINPSPTRKPLFSPPRNLALPDCPAPPPFLSPPTELPTFTAKNQTRSPAHKARPMRMSSTHSAI